MKRTLTLFAALSLCALLALGGSYSYLQHWARTPLPGLETRNVVIAPGTGFSAITALLQREGVIRHPLLLKLLVLLEYDATRLKAGEYALEAGLTPRELLGKMQRGEVVEHSITLPEGLNSREILARLAAEERLSGELPSTLAEGSVLPETYHFHLGESRAALLERMQRDAAKALAGLWEERAEGLPFSTPEEALTLASIVEKETGVDGERGLAASVFINRLRRGMPLQSDPTVIYAMEQLRGEPLGRPLWRRDLQTDHPYNSYTRTGLPPGPIAHPGREAIKAVLNPPQSDYLYFVATGTGGHRFAKSLTEHNRNVEAYRTEMRRQGLR